MLLDKGSASFLHVDIVFPGSFMEKTVFPHRMLLAHFLKSHLTIYMKVFFWVLYSVGLYVYVPVSHYFDCHNFLVSFEIRNCESSYFVLLKKFFRLFTQHSLRFHMNFRVDFLFLQKNIIGILIGFALTL